MNNNSDEIYLAKITQYIEWGARGQIYCIGATVIVAFVVHVQAIAIFYKIVRWVKPENLFILTYFFNKNKYLLDRVMLKLTKWFLLRSWWFFLFVIVWRKVDNIVSS